MEEFLESMADAVSQIVLFSVSETNVEASPSINGVKLVQNSSQAILQIVKDVENKLTTPEMQEKMGMATKNIIDAIEEISRTAKFLSEDIDNLNSRLGLLEGSKKLLQNMVNCLQLVDINQCANLIIISQQIKSNLDLLRICASNTHSTSEFRTLASTLVEEFVSFITATQERKAYISQPNYKQTLDEAKNSISTHLQQLFSWSALVLENPNDNNAENQRQSEEALLLNTVDDIVFVAEESSKGLFDNLSMDLDLMNVMQATSSNFFQTVTQLQETLNKLVESTRNVDKQNAIEQLKAIRPLLAQVSAQISDCVTVTDLVNLTKSCLLNPNNKQVSEKFFSCTNRLKSALTKLLDRADLPTSLTEELRNTIQVSIDNCHSSLDLLTQSVKSADSSSVKKIADTKQSLKKLNQASELAAGLADRLEDESLSSYFIDVNRRIKTAMPPLLAATKSVLLNVNNLSEFDRAKSEAELAVNALNPPPEVLYPETNLVEKTSELNNLLRIFQSRIGSEPAIVQVALKNVLEATKKSAQAIKAFLPFASHPDELQHVWATLANEQILSLAQVTLCAQQSPYTIMQSINLNNSLLLCYVIPDLPTRVKSCQMKLVSAVHAFSTDVSQEKFEQLTRTFNDLVVSAQALAQQTSEPKRKQQILDACKSLNSALNRVDKFFSSLSRSPHLKAMMLNQLEQINSMSSMLIAPPLSDSEDLIERLTTVTIDETVTGKLLQACKTMAEQLHRILQKNLSPADIINSARIICAEAHNVVQRSQKYAALCSDKRLSDQIVLLAVAARTKSVQLKILCAVKAASNSTDEWAEQLSACVLSLTRDLHGCVTAIEIARLRVN